MSILNRDAIIRKIQALRARAADAASTEAEAAMAARKAQELLDKHNLTLDEAQVRADGVERQTWDNGSRYEPAVTEALVGISTALNVSHFFRGGQICIVGTPADVAMALYYIDLVDNAAWQCWAKFYGTPHFRVLKMQGQSARKIGDSFRRGVAIRLGQRIEDQAAEGRSAQSGSGFDLVPIKDAIRRQWMEEHNIRIKMTDYKPVDAGMIAGYAAGADVSISRGVGSQHVEKLALPHS